MKDDITNQQLLDSLTDLKKELKGFATKDDLKAFATKDDLERATIRLERTIRSNHTINVHHHLETRSMVGDINNKFDNLREGLARAVKPA